MGIAFAVFAEFLPFIQHGSPVNFIELKKSSTLDRHIENTGHYLQKTHIKT